MQAVRVGRRMQVADGDMTADVSLTSLVRTVDKEAFAVTARMSGGPPGQQVRLPLSRIVADDDLGNSYHTAFSGGSGVGEAMAHHPARAARGHPVARTAQRPWHTQAAGRCHRGSDTGRGAHEPAGQPCAGERLLDSIAAYC